MDRTIGIIGLGIMGTAMSANLIKAGFQVIGYDILAERIKALEANGGSGKKSCREIAEQADVVITSLPSMDALKEVVHAKNGLLTVKSHGLPVIETSTLTLDAKQEAWEALKSVGIDLLDCPISGTGAQAAVKDIVLYASGTQESCNHCMPVFDELSRKTYYLGEFGMGTKMKLIANLLVTIHNVSAAEAFVLGMKAGLDPQQIYEAISDGAGSSRMFEVRGPLMVEGKYDEPTMKMGLHQKDINIISDFAKAFQCPTPLLSASAQIYTAGLAKGMAKLDTGAVCAVLEEMAGFKRDENK
ncbi:NAD(P)-dependent oxidoreductase [Thermodesulfobacteriota bacterium]